MESHADFLWYLAVLSCRSLGLACVTWLALRVFRVKSASVKHAAWTVVTAVMLLQVVASPALPSVPLRVLAPVPDAGPTLTPQLAFPPVPVPVSNSLGGISRSRGGRLSLASMRWWPSPSWFNWLSDICLLEGWCATANQLTDLECGNPNRFPFP